MQITNHLLALLLLTSIAALIGCQKSNLENTKSEPIQQPLVNELVSGSPFSPGYRWTFQDQNGGQTYLETTMGKQIGDVKTTKLRAKGDSLFWTHEMYVNVANGELRQIATEFQGKLSIESPPQVLISNSLAVGNQWHCKSESKDGYSSTEFTANVRKQESIVVPAGTFETMMIEYSLGFHFGTEYDMRIWFNDEVGIVKIEKWRKSTLGEKEDIQPYSYELATVERIADAHRIDYPSEQIGIEKLPKNVVAPDGQLTLFADYDDVWQNHIVLYLVNKTDNEVNVPAQDSDLYVKLESRTNEGDWVRAQTHQSSSCGNSYHTLVLKPNTFISLLGFLPSKGRKQTARYKFCNLLQLESNVGEVLIDDQIINEAAKDLWIRFPSNSVR